MKIEKQTIRKKVKKVVKPARYKDIETGDFQEVTIIKDDGKRVKEQRMIKERVYLEPIFEEATEDQEIFAVKVKSKAPIGKMFKTDGGVLVEEIEEVHEFANEEDAKNFVKASTRKAGK